MVQFRLEKTGAVAHLTLSRPEKHNAFDDTLIEGLTEALAEVERDDAVSILVLEAEGKSFSAGADLDWMKRAAAQSREAACDVALASSAARFSLSETRLGLIPSAISPYVIAAIGARQARRYFQTAEIFDAAEALRIGLVHEVVEPDALDGRAEALIAALQATAPGARAHAKQLVFDVAYRSVDDDLTEMTAGRIADIRAGAEAREGLDAFLAKRKPAWIRAEEE
jgi:methylglutaconyl-CoA hydratase